jgi:hypothetical protein
VALGATKEMNILLLAITYLYAVIMQLTIVDDVWTSIFLCTLIFYSYTLFSRDTLFTKSNVFKYIFLCVIIVATSALIGDGRDKVEVYETRTLEMKVTGVPLLFSSI